MAPPDPRCFDARPARGVSGRLTVPGDKSISHRSILLSSALADGASEISGFLASEDCLATLRAMRALGVPIEQPAPSRLRVHGVGLRGLKAAPHALDMGNAGTAIRLFTGLLAAQPFDSRLFGDESLMKRPMERVARPLRQMGAEVRTSGGTPPIEVSGGRRLHGIDYAMPVASAQVKLSHSARRALRRGSHAGRLAGGLSRPQRAHAARRRGEDRERGARHRLSSRRSGSRAVISWCPATSLRPRSSSWPDCWRRPEEGLVLQNVGLNPTRVGLLDILRSMGGRIEVEDARMSGAEPVGDLRVRPSALRGVAVPASLVPLAIDEFPVLFIAAACADGETVVAGAQELRVKESDRIAAMAAGLQALGVEHSVTPDGMRIRGRADGPAFGGR